MEGKLYKSPNGEHYYLTVDGKIFAEIGGHPLKTINQSLSLKNCQAIENGYDLDELVKESMTQNKVKKDYLSFDEQVQRSGGFIIGFQEGFQKALSLLGDKKFSEEDMRKAIAFGWDYEGRPKEEMLEIHNVNLEYNNSYFEDTQKYIQSLQQTEWDVEMLMESKDIDELRVDKGSFLKPNDIYKPKLDVDGCLILKRI